MTDVQRRAVLGGAAFSAMAAAAPAVAATRGPARPALPPAGMTVVADRKSLSDLAASVGQIVFLAEPGREGMFACVAGGTPAGDPLQGLYIAAATAGIHYARLWDGTHGRPEWFGAITNDSRRDCADALEACYALCPVSQLSQADYFIRRTLRLNQSWRTFRGEGSYATNEGQGTRIILQNAAPRLHTDDIVFVGSTPRAGGDGAIWENHFSHLTLVRDGPATSHPSGEIGRYPAGLRTSNLLRCTFAQIASFESSVCFYIGGVVYTKFDDCFASRTRPGTTATGDFYVGYLLDGHVSFGYPGGNASLYMNRCIAADQNAAHVRPIGLLAKGAFVDTFIDQFESARIATGMVFAAEGAPGETATIDTHIRNPVLDGCTTYGIDIDLQGSTNASIEILDPYIAAGDGEAGIYIHRGTGLVTITGGQIYGGYRAGSLRLVQTRGVKVQGTKIHQAVKPVVTEGSSGLFLEPQIRNVGKASPHFAISCTGLSRSIVRPIIIGAVSPSFKGGISLDPSSNYSQIDGSAIDQGCFPVVDAAYKIWYDGGDARSGATGGAFTAAGNVLVGVTG